MQAKGDRNIECHNTVCTNINEILNIIFIQDLTLSQTTNFRLFQTETVRRRQFQI